MWQLDLSRQLERRDQLERDCFDELITTNRRLSSSLRLANNENAITTRECVVLRSEVADLRRDIAAARNCEDTTAAIVAKTRVKELEEKLLKLQEELTDSYKEKGKNAQLLLDVNEQLQRTTSDVTTKAEAISSLERQVDSFNEKLTSTDEVIKEKTVTIQVLQDELQALQLELVKTSERCATLEGENKNLLERWLRKMNEEAQRVNLANKILENAQEVQKQQDLAAAANSMSIGGQTPGLLESLRLHCGHTGTSVVPTTVAFSITAHDAEINAISFSTNGTMFATGSNDKRVKIFDTKTGNLKSTLSGSGRGVMAVNFNSTDSMVLGASNDNATRIWDVQTGRIKHTLTGHIGKVFAARFCGNFSKVISGSHDRTVKVWDLNKKYCIRTMFAWSSVNDLVLGDDSGASVISGHLDNHIRFWHLQSGDCTNEITGMHTGQITSLDLSPDKTLLLTNSRDNTLKLIDLRMFQVVTTFCADSYRTGMNWSRACFSPDGKYVAAGSQDGSLYIFNALSSKLETVLKEHTGAISACSWNLNGHQIVTCDTQKNVVLWEGS